MRIRSLLAVLTVVLSAAPALAQLPLGTDFTYQGELKSAGNLADGTYDFQFKLFDHHADTPGHQVGSTQCINNVSVLNGVFTATLDFGDTAFNGSGRWIEISVRADTGLDCLNDTGFTTLSPRQKLGAVPHALYAKTSDLSLSATNLNGQPASFYTSAANLTGTLPSGVLDGAYAGALTLSNPANAFTGAGAGLINLSAAALTTGTVPDARLPNNLARLNLTNSFTAAQNFTSATFVVDPTKSVQFRVDSGMAGLNLTGTGAAVGILRLRNQLEIWPSDGGTRPGFLDVRNADGAAMIALVGATGEGQFIGDVAVDVDDSNDGTAASAVRFGAVGSGEAIGSKRTPGGNRFGLDFYTSYGPRLSIAQNGNVGIGTTSPGAKLDIAVTPAKSAQFRLDGGLVPGLNLTGTGNDLGILRLRNALEIWSSDDASRPGYLDVRNLAGLQTLTLEGATGNAYATGDINVDIDATNPGNLDGALRFGAVHSTEGLSSKRNAGGNQFGLDFYTNNTNRLAITATGNVGIGITTPVDHLQVQDGVLSVTSSAVGLGGVTLTTTGNEVGRVAIQNSSGNTVGILGQSLTNVSFGGEITICNAAGVAKGALAMTSTTDCTLFAQVKSFTVPNPDDAATDIYYACVEGPEAAMYIRGTATLVGGRATVTLPRHFTAMAAAQGITVQVTPSYADCRGLAVTRKGVDSFDIVELLAGATTGEFDWEVKAVRKGYEDFKVIRPAGLLNPKPPALPTPPTDAEAHKH